MSELHITIPDEEEERLAFGALSVERQQQAAKWGQQDHEPERWLAITLEELGEAARALLNDDPVQFHREMNSVAACAVACCAAMWRK